MESLPDDLKRIIAAFAGPAAGARQVAARARTLDEFVEYRLATALDHVLRAASRGLALLVVPRVPRARVSKIHK